METSCLSSVTSQSSVDHDGVLEFGILFSLMFFLCFLLPYMSVLPVFHVLRLSRLFPMIHCEQLRAKTLLTSCSLLLGGGSCSERFKLR